MTSFRWSSEAKISLEVGWRSGCWLQRATWWDFMWIMFCFLIWVLVAQACSLCETFSKYTTMIYVLFLYLYYSQKRSLQWYCLWTGLIPTFAKITSFFSWEVPMWIGLQPIMIIQWCRWRVQEVTWQLLNCSWLMGLTLLIDSRYSTVK